MCHELLFVDSIARVEGHHDTGVHKQGADTHLPTHSGKILRY